MKEDFWQGVFHVLVGVAITLVVAVFLLLMAWFAGLL